MLKHVFIKSDYRRILGTRSESWKEAEGIADAAEVFCRQAGLAGPRPRKPAHAIATTHLPCSPALQHGEHNPS